MITVLYTVPKQKQFKTKRAAEKFIQENICNITFVIQHTDSGEKFCCPLHKKDDKVRIEWWEDFKKRKF